MAGKLPGIRAGFVKTSSSLRERQQSVAQEAHNPGTHHSILHSNDRLSCMAVNSGAFARRVWVFIPKIGSREMLNGPKSIHSRKQPARIKIHHQVSGSCHPSQASGKTYPRWSTRTASTRNRRISTEPSLASAGIGSASVRSKSITRSSSRIRVKVSSDKTAIY